MPSYFLLSKSSLQKVYAHVDMLIFLHHMCASIGCLLDLGVEDNNLQDHVNLCGYVLSFAVAHNSLGLELNIVADWEVAPLDNTGYWTSLTNVVYILFRFFHLLHGYYVY